MGLCVCVCLPESVLWQNGPLDPDAVSDGEWSRSRDGCIRWGGDRRREETVFGVNLGRPIVTNGTWLRRFARATHSSQITLGEDLLQFTNERVGERIVKISQPLAMQQ